MAKQVIPNSGFWSTLAALINGNFDDMYAHTHFAQVAVTYPDPAATFAVTGTGDPALKPSDGGYVKVLNTYTSDLVSGDTCTVGADGRVTVAKAGIYQMDLYADLSHSVNAATVGLTLEIERNAAFILAPRALHTKVPNNSDIINLSGILYFEAEAGDTFGIVVASDLTGNVEIVTSVAAIEFHGDKI